MKIPEPDHLFVSRGGLKIQHALEHFNVSVKGVVALDVGASTGGFTDCLLQSGCKKVYAVDVGYGQLAWKLRQDPRVVVIERTNFRHWDGHEIKEPIDFVVVDVSFISLTLILPKLKELLNKDVIASPCPPQAGGGVAISRDQMDCFVAEPPRNDAIKIIALIKPNFEVGKGEVGPKGVVKDPALHKAVVQKIKSASENLGYKVDGVTESPLIGPAGNKEFLILISIA